MASFTDVPHSFSPYIQQLPVDAYTKVGVTSQQEFDAGIAKVQGYINDINGLPVAKQEDKDYIQGKLGQIKQGITQNLNGDFSDARITNQIGGAVKQVFGDPVVKNAVSSTAAIMSGDEQAQADEKAGKLSPANQYDWQEQKAAYLNDKKVGSTFGGTYTSYTDVGKKALDIVKEISPDTKLTEIPFKRDPADGHILLQDGKPIIDEAMIEESTSGKSVDKIKQALSVGLTDGDYKQLGIDGAYHYASYSPTDMGKVIQQNAQSRVDDISGKINYLKTQQLTRTNDADFQTGLTNSINSYQKDLDGIQKNVADSYKSLSANPDGFKRGFYTQNYLDQSANALSSTNTSFKYLENPYTKQADWQKDFDFKVQDAQAKLLLEQEKLQIEKDKEKKDKSLISDNYVNQTIPTDVNKDSEQSWKNNIDGLQYTLDSQKSNLESKIFDDNMSQANKDAGIELLRDKFQKGEKVAPIVSDYFNSEQSIKRDLDNKKAGLLNIQTEADNNKSLDMSKVLNKYKPVSIEGTIFSPKELINFDSKYQSLITGDNNYSGTGGVNNPFSSNLTEDDSKFSSKEKILYNVMKKHYYGQPLTDEEQNIFDNTNIISQDVNNTLPGILQKRKDYINGELNKIDAVGVPRARQLEVGKEEQRQEVASNIDRTLDNIDSQGGGVANNPNFDSKLARKLNDPSKKDVTYALGQDRDGNYSYIIDPHNGEKTQYIPVDNTTVKSLYGDFISPFENVKATLALTKGKTTNVLGKGATTAYFQKNDFPGVSKYGVTADVEGLTNGGYQLKYHIFDKDNNQWRDVIIPKAFYDEGDLLKSISTTGDLTIKQLLEQDANR